MESSTKNSAFRFHWRCGKSNLTYLCFVDDIIIFSKVDIQSMRIVLYTLSKFARIFGLQCNSAKSAIFMCVTISTTKEHLATLTGFKVGSLPIRYLGVPLVSSHLSTSDCYRLVEIISYHIRHWTSRFLSYARRLQLVNSILFVVQSYWFSIFTPTCRCIQTA